MPVLGLLRVRAGVGGQKTLFQGARQSVCGGGYGRDNCHRTLSAAGAFMFSVFSVFCGPNSGRADSR